MQLAQAIDAWVEAHGPSLSASTQRDIADIRVSVIEVGWAELPCSELDQDVRDDILDEATNYGTLGRSAINEFLNLVVSFAESQIDKDQPEDEGEFVDDDYDDDYEDDEADEADEAEAVEDEEIDHDPEDWVGYLTGANSGEMVEALRPENEPADIVLAGDDEAAASSFFDAIGASTPAGDTEAAVVLDDTTDDDTTQGGVFSAAAEHTPPKAASGVDWITVAYFSVAAICFALVIYFYLSS